METRYASTCNDQPQISMWGRCRAGVCRMGVSGHVRVTLLNECKERQIYNQ